MEPLPTTKWMLTWMGMFPASKSSSMRMRAFHELFAVMLFCGNLFGVAVLSVYIWQFVKIDLIGSLFTFIGLAAYTASLYTIPIAYYLRHRARKIFVQLAMIYDAS